MAEILKFPDPKSRIVSGLSAAVRDEIERLISRPRINCQATVDTIFPGRKYRVNVTGDAARREYVIWERSEDMAAREGMALFVKEMGG